MHPTAPAKATSHMNSFLGSFWSHNQVQCGKTWEYATQGSHVNFILGSFGALILCDVGRNGRVLVGFVGK
jgi:hypothetical protein